MKAQQLEMKSVSVLQKVDFPFRDLFERKDYVQNDGTNDPHKHFLVYQYLKIISSAVELRYV